MSQIRSPIVQESSSRPTTEGSILSSNPSLINRSSYRSKVLTKDEFSFVKVEENLSDGSAARKESETSNDVLDYESQLSPLQDFKQTTNLQLSSVGSLDVLSEIPSACVQLAIQTISSELCVGEIGSFASSEYTSSSKLTPCALKYENFSPATKNAFHRKKAIEEIIETEETYISSLKMLSGIYLDSLISKGSDGVPIRLIHSYINALISNHQSFLKNLRVLFFLGYRFSPVSSPSRTEGLLTSSSPLMAALVSQLINEESISIYLYQELSSLQDLVLRLMSAKESDPEFGATLTRGYQLFLEASQGSKNRMDLSFSSLIQKPISRISKYRLFLESLLKLTPISEDPLCHSKIEQSLHGIDDQIKQVNRYGLQEKFRANLLFENLSFGTKTLKFPVEYLGLPILLGSMHCAWVSKDRQIQSQLFGAFLFKTHLILANIVKYNKYEVKFLVPLSICKVDESSDSMGGIFSNYEHSFKLIFEHRYTLIELLCLQYEKLESEVWKTKLDILVNHVNGPYAFDYSSSSVNEEIGTHCSTIVPHYTQPFDAKLNRLRSVRFKHEKHNIFAQCYFSAIIPVQIERVKLNDDGVKYKTVRDASNTGGVIIQLKEIEKARIEYLLQDLWSEELVSEEILTRREHSTRKVRSRLHTHPSSMSLRTLNRNLQVDLDQDELNRDTVKDSKSTIGNSPTANRSTSRASIFRRTSIVFGGAFKAVMSGDH